MLGQPLISRCSKLMLCYIFILQGFHSAVAQAIVFEIGEIPAQTVWVSDTLETALEFQVKATDVGTNPLYTLSDDGTALGTLQLDSATGEFLFMPDVNDTEPFSVTFYAEENGKTASQSVQVTPLPELKAEQTAFGLQPGNPLPNPEDRRYLSITENVDTGTSNFNGANRLLRHISIVGKTVVFELDHDNGLWSFDSNQDIQDLTIYADKVIVRSALSLPGTGLTIHARELVFEDINGEVSSLSTMPSNIPLTAGGPDKVRDHVYTSRAGTNGYNAGDITLHLKTFMAPSVQKRFIVEGGKGGKAGPGRTGDNGTNRTTYTGKYSVNYGFLCLGSKSWDFKNSPSYTYVSLKSGCDTTTKGTSARPGNGWAATVAGIPGTGGASGRLTYSVDVTSYLNNKGGAAGDRANNGNYYSGGAAGTPTYSHHWKCTDAGGDDESCSTSSHSSSSGSGSYPPYGSVGISQSSDFYNAQYSWLSAHTVFQMVQYIRDVYLYGYFDDADQLLTLYLNEIDGFIQSPEWDQLDPDLVVEEATALLDRQQAEILQAQDEMLGLQQKLQANLDYFGNPVGWSPLLSFEVNRAAFDQEVDTAMDVLWLNYWMSNGANSIAERRNAAKDMVDTLKVQIDDYKEQYNVAIDSIPRLQNEVANLTTDIGLQKDKINQLEEELLPQAKNAAVIRKIGRTLNQVAEVFPFTQPVLNFAGNFVAGIPDIDPDKPLEQELLANAGDSTKDALDTYWNEGIDGQLGDTETLLECAEQSGPLVKACVAMEGAQKLNELRKPVIDSLGSTIKIIAGSSAQDPAVREELNRILAEDSRFKDIVAELKELNTRKTEFATELFGTYQTINFLATALTKNMLAIDSMNEVINHATSALNPRVLGYLDEMAQRASLRLQYYQYQMVRAFEYRLLKPFTKELDLNRLFADFCRVAIAIDQNDLGEGLNGDSCDSNTARNLTKADFDSLKAIYEDQLADIAFEILDEYNNNPSSELTGGVTFDLPSSVIDKLNNEGGATFNLVDDLGLFALREENLRLLSLEVVDVQFDNLNNGTLNYMDICFIHSGISKLRKNGETWLFRHYNDRAAGLIEWRNRYDDGSVSLLPLSAASNSLLASLIGNDNPDLLLYSRPGAWADITLRKEATGSAIVKINSIKVRVKYDFTDQPFNLQTIKLLTDGTGIESLIKIAQADRSGRQDGRGSFLRSFDHGSQVTLEAPMKIGNYQFDGWIGEVTTNDPMVSLTMTKSALMLPLYKEVLVADSDDDGVLDDVDNCLEVKNAAQIDSNGDGYGNACDGDLNNDDIVNTLDVGLFRQAFGTTDPDADFNADGIVNTLDVGRFRAMFGSAPGPSAAQ